MYDVGVGADGGASGASCAGGTSDCLGRSLAIAEATPVHDEFLIKLTRKINRLLDEAREKGKRKHRNLELINVDGQALLAWTSSLKLSAEVRRADKEEVARVLRVQPRRTDHIEPPSASYETASASEAAGDSKAGSVASGKDTQRSGS
jgi:hypothetical protein